MRNLPEDPDDSAEQRLHRRRRMRRHGRKAYIRSVYFLPSMATLGNAVCGFAAIYVSAFEKGSVGNDPIAIRLFEHHFVAAAYLIFLAMIFDALDGRLARFARHTTDFGGQLDSMADVISFGVAPAFLALQFFKAQFESTLPFGVSRLIWAIGALYMSCAAIRLARFNVSNEHGEQHHYSFLGMPSPGAGGVVAAFVLMLSDLHHDLPRVGDFALYLLPLVVLTSGLLMVSNIRYPHIVNRYMKGRKPMGSLVPVLIVLLLAVWKHRYVISLGTLVYMCWGLGLWLYPKTRNATFVPKTPKTEPPGDTVLKI